MQPLPDSRQDPAIDVSHVTKRFRLSGGGSLKSLVVDRLRGSSPPTFTALDDITLQVRRGETVGLIGHNGAGKSTLLAIIAHTMAPTSGTVRTSGSLSSLLELGAGFHPDLSGRENVMLYGAIMGIPRETMRARFDAIVEFAGLREFIDQPVRFYSSGMYVRLGFAVAVQVDPDILLVDEVLAVGDADFQTKCLAKMDDFRHAGKSMILISHDLGTIRRVSDRIAYLSHGRLRGIGDPDELAGRYEADRTVDPMKAESAKDLPLILVSRRRDWGNHEAVFTSVEYLDPDSGAPVPGAVFGATEAARVRLRWHAHHPIPDPVVGYSVEDAVSGLCIHGTNTQIERIDLPPLEGDGEIDLMIDLSKLQAGDYTLSFSIHSADHARNFHRLEHHLLLRIQRRLPFDGFIPLQTKWRLVSPSGTGPRGEFV